MNKVLIGAIVIVLLAGGGWYAYRSTDTAQSNVSTEVQTNSTSTETALPAQSDVRTVVIEDAYQGAEGTLQITDVQPERPATITLWYANLPPRVSGLIVCGAENAGCTEWGENFTPSQEPGAHTVTITSTKGMGVGRFMVLATDLNSNKPVTQSNYFSVGSKQYAVGPVSCGVDIKTTSGTLRDAGPGVRNIDVTRGESIVVSWRGANANYAVHDRKEVAISGTVTLSPTSNEQHIWTFYGTGEAGSVSCGVTVTVH